MRARVFPARAGHVYEKSRIELWLRRSRTSPLTREPMGATLKSVPALARIAAILVARDAVDDDLLEARNQKNAPVYAKHGTTCATFSLLFLDSFPPCEVHSARANRNLRL